MGKENNMAGYMGDVMKGKGKGTNIVDGDTQNGHQQYSSHETCSS